MDRDTALLMEKPFSNLWKSKCNNVSLVLMEVGLDDTDNLGMINDPLTVYLLASCFSNLLGGC